MIYIKGINPTTEDQVYYRRFFNDHCISWTLTLDPTQAKYFENIEIAQNLIVHLLNMKVAITNLEVIESI